MILFALLSLTGCDPYTAEEHTQIDPLHERFDRTCEEYLQTRPLYDERRYNDCDDRDYSQDNGHDALRAMSDYQECQDAYTKYLANADALEAQLYAIVHERDALSFVSWREGKWVCHTEAYWRQDE